jgi:probable rRNA maturation factor
VLEIEVLGRELTQDRGGDTTGGASTPAGSVLSLDEIQRLCARALATAGIQDGHLAVELVSAERIAELNEEHRGKQGPTDVLSFPIDGAEPWGDTPEGTGSEGVPRELGDIVICPEHTLDLREAIVHGALHLLGMDHETDDGEMLALQDRIVGVEG